MMHIEQKAKRYRVYTCAHASEKLVFFRVTAADGPLRDAEIKATLCHFFPRKLTSCATPVRKKLYATLLRRKLVDPKKSSQDITRDPAWVVHYEGLRRSLATALTKQAELAKYYSAQGYLVLTTRIL